MKKITLKSLTVKNFKGIKTLDITPGMNTEIHGANGTGKTSIFDAFTWVLYGKNSNDQKDFSIKTLDENGQPISQLDHEVEIVLNIDGKTKTLKRVYREKWTKRRGEETAVLNGHESAFWVDEVPKTLSEFNEQVGEIIDEAISKTITNPAYFNEKLKWTERREILTNMAGDIDEPGMASAAGLDEVLAMFNNGRSLEDQKKVIAGQRKKLKEEADQIPPRIDELHNTKPEAKDWEAIEIAITENTQQIEKIEKTINDKTEAISSQNEKRTKERREILELEDQLDKLTSEALQESNQKRNNLTNRIKLNRQQAGGHTGNADRLTQHIEQKENEIKEKNARLDQLRGQFKTIKGEQFIAEDDHCPTCKREYEDAEGKTEELRESFNTTKLKRLANNRTAGGLVVEDIKALEAEKAQFEIQRNEAHEEAGKILEEVQKETEESQKPIKLPQPTAEMVQLQQKIEAFELPEAIEADTEELKDNRKHCENIIEQLKKSLYDREQIEKIDKRSEELKAQQRQLGQQLTDLEKIEFEIDQFNRLKIQEVEKRVNDRFALASFKMFEQQVNGAQAPACECMVNGVPYNDLNTANKINVGIDVLNALQHYYEIAAPVFIDNRESVTNLQPVSCQIISLVVDPAAKELEILNL